MFGTPAAPVEHHRAAAPRRHDAERQPLAHDRLESRILGGEILNSVIERQRVQAPGRNASARTGVALENAHLKTLLMERSGAGQTGNARPHDRDARRAAACQSRFRHQPLTLSCSGQSRMQAFSVPPPICPPFVCSVHRVDTVPGDGLHSLPQRLVRAQGVQRVALDSQNVADLHRHAP
jgi:hypothetical protein